MATLSFIICFIGYVINTRKDNRLPFSIYNCINGYYECPPWLKKKLMFKSYTTFCGKLIILSIVVIVIGTDFFDKKVVSIAKWLLFFNCH